MEEQDLFDRLTLELNGYNPELLVPMQKVDINWQRLKQEQSQPKVQEIYPEKMFNCIVTQWLDSDSLSATYDIHYNDHKELKKHINGIWSNEEPNTSTANKVYDSLLTLVARSNDLEKIKISRFYKPNDIKTVVRDFYLIQIAGLGICASWFVFNDEVYPARLDDTNPLVYKWIFNHKKKISLDEFCDKCWNAV